MSAIFGILHRDGKPVSREDLGRMDAALEAFGPDGHGIWSNGHIGMGQREMHFTPEDRFNQLPLKSADGQRVLVCDARVDNRPELMHLLDIRPADAKEMPDSAFIMRAYEKWGQDCVKHLIGDISFALWDQVARKFLLACSAMSHRPLFYYSNQNMHAFSSRPQGLFVLDSIPRKLNLERIADYLAQSGNALGTGLFQDIHQLLPGHALIVCRESLIESTIWEPDRQKQIFYPDDNDYVDAFNELFERVVSDYLRCVSPAGCMMSGGLDSTSIAATAATQLKMGGKRLATFTEVPRPGFDGKMVKGRYADESRYVQAMAQKYDNIDLNLIWNDGRTYLDDLHCYFDFSYMLFPNASNRVWYEDICRTAKDQGVRVLLNGKMGNSTISKTGDRLLQQLVSAGKWQQALQEAHSFHKKKQLYYTLRTFVGQGIVPLLPVSIQQAIKNLRGISPNIRKKNFWIDKSTMQPAFAKLQQVEERAHERAANSLYQVRLADCSIRSGSFFSSVTAAIGNIDHSYRGMFGVELRDPAADRRIVEFCLSLPEDQFLKNGENRRLIRRAMKGKLPDEILGNNMRGLQSADWFERLSGSLKSIQQTLTEWENSPLLPNVLDLNRLHTLVKNMPLATENPGDLIQVYRGLLERSLMMGSFIRWFETGEGQHV